MLVDIDKIVVQDRIRKDFGDIEELAQDIKENGLINPPVINRDNVLIAGERRLRACKSLGWDKIEVNQMDTRDAEHELNIEISENEVRKEFSKAERADYMRRLMRIESAKAKERQGSRTDLNPDIPQNSAGSNTETRNIVSSHFGISRDTMKREMDIVDNKSLFTEEEFRDWDEGKLSTNKAYQMVKARLKELEAENEDLKNRKPEYIEVEVAVTPPDYDEAKEEAQKAKDQAAYNKRYADLMESKNRDLRDQLVQSQTELKSVKDAIEAAENSQERNVRLTVGLLKSATSSFIEQYGGFVWLADYIESISDKDLNDCINALHALSAWSEQMIINLTKENYNEI